MMISLIRSAEESVVFGLLVALWMTTLLCGDLARLIEWDTQRFGSHGWSAFLNHCSSIYYFIIITISCFIGRF